MGIDGQEIKETGEGEGENSRVGKDNHVRKDGERQEGGIEQREGRSLQRGSDKYGRVERGREKRVKTTEQGK
jgi:hypothetical protein